MLFDRKLPAHLIHFFSSWYKEERMCVRWGNTFSDSFPVSNSVWQGGVLLPILFTIYIDDLLGDLSEKHWTQVDSVACPTLWLHKYKIKLQMSLVLLEAVTFNFYMVYNSKWQSNSGTQTVTVIRRGQVTSQCIWFLHRVVTWLYTIIFQNKLPYDHGIYVHMEQRHCTLSRELSTCMCVCVCVYVCVCVHSIVAIVHIKCMIHPR